MFCKGLSFLLLLRSLEATLAKPTQRSEDSSCKDKTCGRQSRGMSIIQVGSEQTRTKPVSLEEENEVDGAGKKKTFHTAFNAVQHWQDIMQFDLFPADDLSKGKLVVSQEQWLQAFNSLDKNGDGQLSGDDIDAAYAETASHHLNVSTDHYRLALAEMARHFPEFSNFMIAHEPVICYFAETNTSAPSDAPLPDEQSMALFAQRSRKLALLEAPNECQQALGTVAYEAISLSLSFASIQIKDYLGDHCPPDWMRKLETVHQQVDKDLLKQIGDAISRGDYSGAADHLWTMVVELFDKGATMSLIEIALSAMDWWEWSNVGVTMIANMIAHFSNPGDLIPHLVEHVRAEGQKLGQLAVNAFNKCT